MPPGWGPAARSAPSWKALPLCHSWCSPSTEKNVSAVCASALPDSRFWAELPAAEADWFTVPAMLALNALLHVVMISDGHDDLCSCLQTLHNLYFVTTARTGTLLWPWLYQWAQDNSIEDIAFVSLKSTAGEKSSCHTVRLLVNRSCNWCANVWNKLLLACWAAAAHHRRDHKYHHCWNLNGLSAYVLWFRAPLRRSPKILSIFLWSSGTENRFCIVLKWGWMLLIMAACIVGDSSPLACSASEPAKEPFSVPPSVKWRCRADFCSLKCKHLTLRRQAQTADPRIVNSFF